VSTDYQLLDSGHGRRLERFGRYTIDRPCTQALWAPRQGKTIWKKADAFFERINDREGKWHYRNQVPESWTISVAQVTLKLSPTPFGHLGIFPEHLSTWAWLEERLSKLDVEEPRILNLFAYTGASTMVCAKNGAFVVHLDASRPVVGWAKENAMLSSIPKDRIAWVLDDVGKFLAREERRGKLYDGIILDPPTFGRGPKKEVFKIEEHLKNLFASCSRILSKGPNRFILSSCHTPGITPQILTNALGDHLPLEGTFEWGEMMNQGEDTCPLPTGIFSRWVST
jgi:23S rRNA (cytosine1962-C5)-methyltransferase